MAAVNIHTEEFKEKMQGGKPVLVDYWAPWCGYCRRIGPAYDRVADEAGEKFEAVKINIDEDPKLAEEQGIEVIPTLVLYKDGKAVDSVVAPDSKAAIDRFLAAALAQ